MTAPTLGDIPTRHLAAAIRSAALLGKRDRIGFAWRGQVVEATVAAIRAELARRGRAAGAGRGALMRRLRRDDILDLGA